MLYVDRLVTSQPIETKNEKEDSSSSEDAAHGPSIPSPLRVDSMKVKGEEEEEEERIDDDEEEPLIRMVECRICQEEDHIKNLETPCACNGSVKVFIHETISSC